jgi:hypothetical protein
MPDSARAAMPNSPLQPLPLYLRPDFAQSLDRDRPRELIIPLVKGKPAPEKLKRMGSLEYRYLDNGETTTVPNIWYNQTLEMRLSWWSFEEQRTREALARAEARLAEMEANEEKRPSREGARELRMYRWTVDDQRNSHARVVEVLANVTSGKVFC